MAHSASHIMSLASSRIDAAGGFVPFIREYGLGGVAMAIFIQVIEGIGSAGGLLLGPPRALGQGLIALIDATLGGMVDVFGAGTATTIYSFTDGTAALLGPLAQPASVGVIMITFAVFIYGINRLEISPLSFIQSVRN